MLKLFNQKTGKVTYLGQCWFGICTGVSGWDSVSGVVSQVHLLIDFATALGALVAIGFIIWGGYDLIMSHGVQELTINAQNKIENSIIGLIVIFLARMIVVFVIDNVL